MSKSEPHYTWKYTNLQAKHTDTTSSLHENDLAGLQRLQAIQCIPAGESRTREGSGLESTEIFGGLDQALLIEDAELTKGTINHTSEASL